MMDVDGRGREIKLPIGNCKTIFLLLRSKLAVSLSEQITICAHSSPFSFFAFMVFLPMFYSVCVWTRV